MLFCFVRAVVIAVVDSSGAAAAAAAAAGVVGVVVVWCRYTAKSVDSTQGVRSLLQRSILPEGERLHIRNEVSRAFPENITFKF